MKICQVEAELFHADDGRTDGRTDMTKLIVAFRSSANARKNRFLSVYGFVSDRRRTRSVIGIRRLDSNGSWLGEAVEMQHASEGS